MGMMSMKRGKAFTLIEIVVAVAIVGILATIGIPAYQNFVESSREKVCETNLLTLKKAVEMYIMDHDAVPGALSELSDGQINKAYARVMSGKDAWQRKLASFVVEGLQSGTAYAALYGMPKLSCPNNPIAASVSYGLNCRIAGLSALEYKGLDDSVVIVADSGDELFEYPGAGGILGSAKYDDNYYVFRSISIWAAMQIRGHRKFQPLSSADYYFKGMNKGERAVKIDYMGNLKI